MSESGAPSLGASVTSPSRALVWCVAHRWPVMVWAAMIVWSVALFVAARTAFETFQLPRFDLGNMVQAVWNTAHGHPLEVTHATGEQALRLAGHIDPILTLFAPFWIVAPNPLVLVAIQISACSLGALPVFWLGRRHLGSEPAAALLAVAYLAYPWLAWTAIEAFHPVTVALPLLLFAVWFLDSGRLWAFAACAALVLATGELMGLAVAGMGIWYWLARGRRIGLAIAAMGVAWSAFAIKVLVPAFSGGDSIFYDRFASVGGSPMGLVRTVFTDPGVVLSAVLTADDLADVLSLGLPAHHRPADPLHRGHRSLPRGRLRPWIRPAAEATSASGLGVRPRPMRRFVDPRRPVPCRSG